MWKLLSDTYPTSKKERNCDFCGKPILMGEIYHKYVYSDNNGHIHTDSVHYNMGFDCVETTTTPDKEKEYPDMGNIYALFMIIIVIVVAFIFI